MCWSADGCKNSSLSELTGGTCVGSAWGTAWQNVGAPFDEQNHDFLQPWLSPGHVGIRALPSKTASRVFLQVLGHYSRPWGDGSDKGDKAPCTSITGRQTHTHKATDCAVY